MVARSSSSLGTRAYLYSNVECLRRAQSTQESTAFDEEIFLQQGRMTNAKFPAGSEATLFEKAVVALNESPLAPEANVESQGEVDASIERARRFMDFRQHGRFTMAYATLQPGMKYFEAYGGYIAYDQAWGVTFVLGDPVAAPEDHARILEAFIRSFPRACFCQVSGPVGAILSRLGWFVNEFGADVELDLPTYDFSGSGKSKLRQALRKSEREGFVIEEGTIAESQAESIERLNEAWRATKVVRQEARFLVRPLTIGDERGVRNFLMRSPAGEIVAFIKFDPICEGGAVVGYSPAVKRHGAAAPTGAEEAITGLAIQRFREEGFRVMRLGLLPFHHVEKSAYHDVWLLRTFFQWAYEHGNQWLYNFRGLADFKHRFRGREIKTYFATPTRWNLRNLLAVLRVCRFLPSRTHFGDV